LIKIKDEVVDEVETITDNDEWELVREFGFFEEVLDLFWIIKNYFPGRCVLPHGFDQYKWQPGCT
jgi:hypothetical protein